MPLNIDWQQILLHLMNFVILAGGLYFLLYKPVKQFMAKREETYAARDAAAEEKLAEIEKMKASYEEKLRAAEDEMREKREEAMREIDRDVKARLADAQAQADEIVERANKAAKAQKVKAFAENKRELRALAEEAVEKLATEGSGSLDAFLDAAEREQAHE